MDALALLKDLAAVLGAAMVMGLIFYRLKQPVIIGYLIGGLIVGPFGLQFVSDAHAIETLAEIGVVLLMFALGLEMSLGDLKAVGRIAIGGGLLQVVLVVALVTGAARLGGLPLGTALLLGFIIALSSTVIVLKVLMERGEIESMHGRIAMGMLIVQDLCVVPMMVMLPNLRDPASSFGWPLLLAMGKAVAVIGVLGWLGMRLFPWLMHRVARTRNKELFLLAGIGMCFGTAAVISLFGLSLALGAFLAGVIVSESDHSHQVLADVLPLRDLFATVFFVSVGMQINPGFVFQHWAAVAAVVAAIVLGKAVVIAGLVRVCGAPRRTALAVALSLAQIGEFSIVLAKVGHADGILSDTWLAVVLASALLTIVMTPLLIQATGPLSLWLGRWQPPVTTGRRPAPAGTSPLPPLAGHVVICGFGRVGSTLGEVLHHHAIPLVVVDMDTAAIQSLRGRGVPCIYGDASNASVLRHAALATAKLLIVALPDPMSCRLALEHAKRLNPALRVVVRAHRTEDVATLYAQGADQVIQPEFEASIEAIRATLLTLGYTSQEVHRYAAEIRRVRYSRFPDLASSEAIPELVEALGSSDLQWLEVGRDAPLAGQSIKEADIRSRTGAAILAVRRLGVTRTNPDPDEPLHAGDHVLVIGHADQLHDMSLLLRSA